MGSMRFFGFDVKTWVGNPEKIKRHRAKPRKDEIWLILQMKLKDDAPLRLYLTPTRVRPL